ncbi:MAG: hypothetical protein QUS14_04050 [Pyrinomonadaceae bacterium]|nr:hypothetical protein [Pyrinomonadaceae bacterium]
MNYFNYFTEIEETFVRRRGRNLLLSPIDWAMIEGWQERGIPLHIVLRAIEGVFDNFEKNPGPRTIKSLMFCREEVEAQFAEWLTSQVGKHADGEETPAESAFSREAIEKHIQDSIDRLRSSRYEPIKEDLERAATRLEELKANLNEDHATIDRSLMDIEGFLDHALLSNPDKPHLKALEKEVTAQLKAYKAGMEKEAYEQTFRLMLLKRLRDEADIPRLGLFYL